MKFERFCKILNKHIFEGEKIELLRKIAVRPERYIGLFRPSKPATKILQNLLQSHEIKFGDAVEELIQEFLREFGFKILNKNIRNSNNELLTLDQYFTDGKRIYFIEQKVRDDHDSSKKRGQISNFEAKLGILYKKNGKKLVAMMYFVDPDLIKNKNFYIQELKRLSSFYGIKIYLFYGKELFEFFNHKETWEQILEWLKKWKESLPEVPEIDFDKTPKESFEEIKELEIRYWRKLLENEILWKEGIIKAVFRKGDTLRLLLKFFESKKDTPYQSLASLLKNLLKKYY
ncbi:restriction endonuclease [Candidatus Pacearchaeota archaeon ex4484_26]|nr:MAG: restriction endonuclease [Candidatus Pacearchaeota archaeon ex4484_26]